MKSFTPGTTIRSADVNDNFTELVTSIASVEDYIVPTGGIIMWSGAVGDIPSGWALCNGSSGTPDLRNRFIVGAGSTYAVAATGGANTHTLTIAQMPSHNHSGSSSSSDSVGERSTSGDTNGTSYIQGTSTLANASSPTHSHTITIASQGGGGSHENRPPYYALCFIMKL